MKTQLKQNLLPTLFTLAALVLLVFELTAQTVSPARVVTAAILNVVAAGVFISHRMKADREKQGIQQTVASHVSSFLFNPGGSNAETALTDLGTELNKAISFIKNIGEGKFDVEYKGMTDELSNLNKENLSGELMQMKRKMQLVAEEDKQRAWSADGVAKFSEIVRQQNKSTEDILSQFISELVKYIGANQGGIFVVNDQDPNNIILELKGCYAYGRRKYVERVITPGEGLVGQAYLEGDLIFLKDIPKNYVAITSGLGEATPRCVVLVPLKNNDVIEGVIEIASFEIWKKHEVDFLRKVSEILGSAISAIRVNDMTKKLLGESREQAEQLRSQEEQLRQNLEELNATQEAVERKSKEAFIQNTKLNAILDSAVDAILTFDERGVIETINRAGVKLLGASESELVGMRLGTVLQNAKMSNGKVEFNELLRDHAKIIGQAIQMEAKRSDGNNVPIELSMNVAEVDGKKIFTGILRDIAERIKSEHDQQQYIEELRAQEEELKQNMEELQATQDEIHRQMLETAKLNRELDARVAALNVSTIVSEADVYGGIVYINDKFCEVSQYSREELIGKPHNTVRHPDMPKEVFRLMWQTIKQGKVFRGIVKNRKKDGTHYWVDAVISPVLDDEGKPVKYIGVRYVIEDEQQAQTLFDNQLRKLGLLDVKVGNNSQMAA